MTVKITPLKEALTLLHSYLNERKQRVKVNGPFSSWRTSTQGLPQGSVLGPLLFNIYINDLLIISCDTDICNYADDTSYSAHNTSRAKVIGKLEKAVCNSAIWFTNNYMKLNTDKCHLMIFGKNEDELPLKIGSDMITESKDETLLGVIIDRKLSFKSQVCTLCKKANQKLDALSRISRYMDSGKLRQIMRTFLLFQFSYCPLLWMIF